MDLKNRKKYREMRSPIIDAGKILADLSNDFAKMVSSTKEFAFVDEVIKVMMEDDNTDGDVLLDELLRNNGSEDAPKTPTMFKIFLVIAAYCVQAMKAQANEDREKAWTYIADAAFWYGMAFSTDVLANKGMVGKNLFAELGKRGAESRHAPINALKNWTIEKYRAGSYKSANSAAHALKDEVLTYGRTIGAVLSSENAQRTIADWIRKAK